MHTRKLSAGHIDSLVSGRLPYLKSRHSGTGGRVSGAHMRSPVPQPPDNDLTLINPIDDTDNDESDERSASSDAYFHWEEEETLFSDLLEDTPASGDTDLIALAESLQKPFDEESRQLKKDIARTSVPVVNKIKEALSAIEQDVILSSGVGVLNFNDACREIERSIEFQHDSVQKAQAEYQASVTELLGQLEAEYASREQLWANFGKALDELVDPILEMLNEAPAKLERTIASIEKQSRILEKEGANVAASATELTLRDLLSKLK